MKKLMILLLTVAALVQAGQAEASFRLTITVVDNADSVTSAQFYDVSSTNASIAFAFGGFDTPDQITGTADVLTSNFPGTTQGAFIKQNIRLYNNAGSAISLKSITFMVEEVETIVDGMNVPILNPTAAQILVAIPDQFQLPSSTKVKVVTSLSANNQFILPNNSTSQVQSNSYLNGSLIDSTAFKSAVSGSDLTSGSIALVGAGYTLANTLVYKPVAVAAGVQNIQFTSTSSLTGVVPEPTSLALAGFAGIGMAVGAIRRRRQAKQAA